MKIIKRRRKEIYLAAGAMRQAKSRNGGTDAGRHAVGSHAVARGGGAVKTANKPRVDDGATR